MIRSPKEAAVPVIFVHGLIGHLRMCSAPSRTLRARAIAPDLLGYGDNREVSEDGVSLDNQIQALKQSIESAFGDSQVDLVGHSVGGAISMLFAFRCPQTVRRIVNIEGNFTLKDAFWSSTLAAMSEEQVEHTLGGFREDPAKWLEGADVALSDHALRVARECLEFQTGRTVRSMARSIVEVTGAPEYRRTLQAVMQATPTFLLAGARSRGGWAVPDWALRIAKGNSVIADAGHMMMIDKLAELMSAVEESLQAPPPQSPRS
jgi:lipase